MRKNGRYANVTRNSNRDTQIGSIDELEICTDSTRKREWTENGEWGAIPEHFKPKNLKTRRDYRQNIRGSSVTFSVLFALLLVCAGFIVGDNFDSYPWDSSQKTEMVSNEIILGKEKSYVYNLFVRKQLGDYSQDFTIELPNGDEGIIRCHLYFPEL